MKYGSCFSGIEAASVAWHPLGWEGQWFSEIEPFPSAVLAHRFPNVPNLGDITQIHNDERFEKSTIDLLVGGSPCQSFSVAGLRKGLSDPRGNLMLTFLSVAERKKPRWIVWENVPGVLSSNGGRDFASFLTALAELGYGFSYRVLDAQYFGVAQRRRRVFVVGYLGDWRPTAAVLFESHSLQGNPKPSRKKREEATAGSERGVGKKMYSGNVESQITSTLETTCNDYSRADGFTTILEPIVIDRAAFNQGVNAQYESRIEEGETMSPLVAKGPHGVAHAFKVRGGSSGETGEQGGKPGRVAGKGYLGQDECVFTIQATQDQMIAQPICFEDSRRDSVRINGEISNTLSAQMGTGGNNTPMIAQPIALAENTIGRKPENGGNGDGFTEGGPMYTLNTTGVHGIAQPLPFNTTQITSPYNGNNPKYGDPCHTLASTDHPPAIAQPLAVDCYNQTVNENTSQTIGSSASDVNHYGAVLHSMAIRRLTPTECERLQGFPDSWTQIPYRNKPADLCPDGPRYKACGNSMAVPVMRWIGERINLVENLLNQNK
jgi:DNA (cytosine-5)-methyltransferase 1